VNQKRDFLPVVIQGGMGIAVSSWQLARAVSQTGQLGVVSGTAIDSVFARRLQNGDESGDLRRALAHFPFPEIAHRVLDRYFRAEGRSVGHQYIAAPKLTLKPSPEALELLVVSNFAEVWLAKEGHDGLVGINYLEKIQMATPSSAYGAMLAGVDYVLMGAGIPAEIPQLLNDLAQHKPGSLNVQVDGATTTYKTTFHPESFTTAGQVPLHRPKFLAIISAHVLATYLAKDEVTRPDGFVIEGFVAGGHNAPPRGHMVIDDNGEPVFGPRDEPDIEKVAKVGLPFWLAGGYSSPEHVRHAQSMGAVGVQVGTLFSLAKQTGLTPELRQELLAHLRAGDLVVRTDPYASPTGFPFKVVTLTGTLSQSEVYAERPRLCDLGYLRVPYERSPGTVGYRCSAEPTHVFIRKGGLETDALGRKCLCNGLMANIGLEQRRGTGYTELPLLTLGADLSGVLEMLKEYPDGWSAEEAVDYLLKVGVEQGSMPLVPVPVWHAGD
jgi:NAD(P)H-dependent flavin oxidoreductase YrpB (nitropropane dioxygenase family)